MHRLLSLEKQVVGEKKVLTFEDFKRSPTIDRQEFK